MNFENLVNHIVKVHGQLAKQATQAVNVSLTLRNWLIGLYIAEYELRGADRAKYGDNLLSELTKQLTSLKISNCNRRQLYRYLRFYRLYPTIVRTLSPQLNILPARLINQLSYSHIELVVDLEDDLKRTFYEIECIRGNWSVRELKRQINSLYFERSGFSKDKKKLAELAQSGAEQAEPKLAIRDPYIFEFLGLKPREVMSETDLEDRLLDKLQDFLLELGRGFCFEARQKRILIGDDYFFVDLVFFHRILKCHVLIDLKLEEFSHQNIGQLNTYLNWYHENEMTEGDNPPVGILMCTKKNHALVKYALAGIDNRLFVSKYQLELPDSEQMRAFLEQQLREAEGGGTS